MYHRVKRTTSLMLAVLLLLSLLAGSIPAYAATGEKIYNDGTRNEICTTLSDQAIAYYTDNYTWEALSVLDGGNENCLETDNALFQSLNRLMSDTMTSSLTYSNLKKNGYVYSDTTKENTDSYSLFYSSGLNTDYANNVISREHVWPKSHATFHEKNGGADLHHLRPEYNSVNSSRGNYVLGNVNGLYEKCSIYKNNDSIVFYKYGDDNSTSGRCEVPDNVKGDVARILLYVWCRWEQPNLFMDISDATVDSSDTPNKNKNDGIRVIESLETLLQWCEADPVDTWEMGRNDATERIQGNRNVFIDYPEYAWLLFGQEIPEKLVTPSQSASICKHENTELKNATAATCTTEGYSGDLYCTDCQQLVQAGTTVASIDHSYTSTVTAPTCAEEGYTLYTCSACGHSYRDDVKKATDDHSFGDWVVVTEAEGLKEHICTVCGKEERVAIEKLPSGDAADSGSDFPVVTVVVGATTVLLVVIFLFLKKK